MVFQTDRSVELSAKLASALPPSVRLMASALGGDRNAFERLAAYPKLNDEIVREGIGPALARAAEATGVVGSCVENWQSQRLKNLNQNAIRMQAQGEIALAFSSLDLRWVPLNGPPMYSAIFSEQDDRPPSNIQMLVLGDFGLARQVCARLGWRALHEGASLDRYLEDEGWVWRAQHENGLLLDLYFRFGPWAPDSMNRAFVASVVPDASLGPTGMRLDTAETYVITAVRLALSRSPRALKHWWDLQMIVANGDIRIAEQVHQRARENGLHVLVGFSAAVAAGLWGHESNRLICKLLKAPPRWESMALKLAIGFGPIRVPASVLLFARLMDGRQSRLGSKAVWRRFWRHPGIVEYQTPDNWPWPLRRASHLLKSTTIGTPRPFSERF